MSQISKQKKNLDLLIQVNPDQEVPKTCKSTTNSPNYLSDFITTAFQASKFSKDDDSLEVKTDTDPTDTGENARIKGFEAMGLFSDFCYAKKVSNLCENDKPSTRRRTIHITDFMGSRDKRNILKNAGGSKAYFLKKQEFEKEKLLRDNNLKKFFHHKEKLPEFFSPPPISPRFLNLSKGKEGSHLPPKPASFNHIIDKCNEALMIKPSKALNSSNSPKFTDSEIYLKKNKKNFGEF